MAEYYQTRVNDWMLHCFDERVAVDRVERNHRFLEEALELVQAAGGTTADAHALVDYVFSRPVGALDQEVGGTMVCLAALCNAHGVSMDQCGETELQRNWANTEKIHAKWLKKAIRSDGGPLP
jgi:NTP pyrophosphatase (non-canonical NTP hydrolase)